MTEHTDIDVGFIHVAHQWEYADSTARLAATGFVAADVGKLAVQLDDYSFYVLSDDSPITWVGVGGGGGVTAPLTLDIEDAVNNDVTDLLILDHKTSGSPAAGLGSGIQFQGESSTTESQLMGVLKFLWRVVTHATRTADLVITTMQQGTEFVRAVIAGTGPNLGATGYDGNARGEMAVDLQGIRWGAATQVASGDLSTIGGGGNNTASGYAATAAGGYQNLVSGDYGLSAGTANTASGRSSIALGGGSIANKSGQLALSSGGLSGTNGQISLYHLRRQITHGSAAWTELQLGPTGAETRITIASDSAWAFEALIVGATSGMGKSFAFHIRGMIENDGGTTSIKGTPTVTVIDDSDDVSFDARATADDTNDALLIEVSDSDGAGDAVRWSARVQTAEIIF
jgi:hypothetical protein